MKRMNFKNGQSTVEYILLVTAVIAVAILFLVSKDSPFQTHLNSSLKKMASNMETMVDRLTGSSPSNAPAAVVPNQ